MVTLMNTTSRSGRLLRFVLPAVCLIAFDQATKLLAAYFLKGNPSVKLIPGVFEFFYLENRGAAFGMFKGRQLLLSRFPGVGPGSLPEGEASRD